MKLVNKVKTILSGMVPSTQPQTGPYLKTVMYDSGFSANVRIDRNPTPAALFYLLSDWNLDVTTQTVRESANIEVFFFDVCQLDAKGETKDAIIQNMEILAKDFISRILEDKSIRMVGDSVRIQSSYGKFDKFCVGVAVNLKIEEKQASCLQYES